MKTPEAIEKDKVKAYLDEIGAFYFSAFMAGYGRKGVPDIIACIDGKFFALEVKAEGKEPTAWQLRCMKNIKSSGGFIVWGEAAKIISYIEDYYSYRY